MIIKKNIFFYPQKRKGKLDAHLHLRVRWNDEALFFNVGYKVNIDKWSKDTQRCKNGTSHGEDKVMASVINHEINKYEEAVESVFDEFEKEERIPTKEELRELVLEKVRRIVISDDQPEEKATFIDIFNQFTNEMGIQNAWTVSTYKKFNTVKNHLLTFDPDMDFDKLDENGLTNYMIYLRDDLKLRNSTIKKQLEFLKWFLRWSTAKGYMTNHDFLTFSPKLKDTGKRVVFLEWDELMKIYNFVFPDNKKYLERVRDVFCFCCFTSLRYSDVANLRWHNVYEGYIEITTVKTADSLKIELNDYSSAILHKYEDAVLPDDRVLPVISNQRMNLYLKEMAYVCGIDTPVSNTYYML